MALTDAERRVAAGPRWIATGDAGVRALVAWYMGWEPARQTAGRDWMAPYLAELLSDPYSAVRGVAERSLRTLPDFEDLDYDFVAATGIVGEESRARVQTAWAVRASGRSIEVPGPLLRAEAGVNRVAWERLVARRNNFPIALSE